MSATFMIKWIINMAKFSSWCW